MIEIIRHTFGLCGEGHPSLLCMLGLGPVFLMMKSYVSLFCSKVISFIKLGLEPIYKFLRYNQR
jgi:hypothetical protein